ncbi:ctr copper transporter [Pseudomassariella vexata]|uniref:Copper transport protein n=1 Tax=Pseudomassariella vexata TaxID=1141098 RepID=A0A1Y2E3I8_9PEZI|nr:ctr copper transporter [Pseudomassariella vexata]ORY65924.1 ctr copper transporter [Pseudomassariella vexata]
MDHSLMDHGEMGHGDMGHGDMGHGGGGMGDMCSMNMLFTWDSTNLCIIFQQWHVRGPASLVFSLLAIVAICAGYEALREATRRYESWSSRQNELPTGSNQVEVSKRAHVVKAALYAAQTFYAFMIMLLFMTYNGWVMVSVAIGTFVGYVMFGTRTGTVRETACH